MKLQSKFMKRLHDDVCLLLYKECASGEVKVFTGVWCPTCYDLRVEKRYEFQTKQEFGNVLNVSTIIFSH